MPGYNTTISVRNSEKILTECWLKNIRLHFKNIATKIKETGFRSIQFNLFYFISIFAPSDQFTSCIKIMIVAAKEKRNAAKPDDVEVSEKWLFMEIGIIIIRRGCIT